MKKSDAAPLSDLITNLASDVVTIQKNMDAQFEEDHQKYIALLAHTPEECREYLRPLAPVRQRLSKYDVNARISLQTEKTVGASLKIGVNLLNVSADMRFQRDTSKDNQISFHVKQIPLNQYTNH